jgi:hypothetical protein
VLSNKAEAASKFVFKQHGSKDQLFAEIKLRFQGYDVRSATRLEHRARVRGGMLLFLSADRPLRPGEVGLPPVGLGHLGGDVGQGPGEKSPGLDVST